ncbi:MAG: MurR/RpiR family transcriptional regulator [Rhabdaerophilum sp.]
MSTLLERLRHAREGLTGRERKIAAALEQGYPHAGLESATALGERVGASAATVVRFAAKLGYAGYPDLQRELRSEVEARLATPLQRLEQAAQKRPAHATHESDVPARTFEVALATLTRSFGALDRHTLDQITLALTTCRGRVLISGEKKGRAIALYLYAQLNLCLPHVTLLTTDAGFEGDQLIDVGPDDIFIAVDVRRYVRRGLAAADWAASQGTTLIVLADSTASPLYAITTLRLCATTNSAGAFDSYIGLMLAADIISNLVVARSPQSARERISRGEKAWEQLGVFGMNTAR